VETFPPQSDSYFELRSQFRSEMESACAIHSIKRNVFSRNLRRVTLVSQLLAVETMGGEKLELLLVENDLGDAQLLKVFLADSSLRFEIAHTMRLSDALQHIAHGIPDIVLMDLELPDSSSLSSLRAIRRAAPDIPVVVVTGSNDEDLAIDAVKRGAQDCLVKGTISSKSLVRALRYALERQEAQVDAERARFQQIALKDEFLSHVSHELRSPLNAIYQFVYILDDGLAGECNAQQREYLQIISRNVSELQSMIGELLDVTRAGAGKLNVDLQLASASKVLGEAMDKMRASAAAKHISLSEDVPSNLPPAYADPARLLQVLVNLLENAIKFTRSNGKVEVKVSVLPGEPEMLQFSVSDTGCGINPELYDRIFERLYQVSAADQGRQGLGLGLYICRELITRQRGRIWVESSSDAGSTFCFTLPVLSVPRLLAPILSPEAAQANSIALVGVELCAADTSPKEDLSEAAANEVRNVLARNVLPDLDVLLPKLHVDNGSEFLFIAARTDVEGAEVITNRLRRQLGRNEYLRREKIEWSIGVRILPLPQPNPNNPEDDIAERMAGLIRSEIDEWTHLKRNENMIRSDGSQERE
jgi:signal transduction histidine kinase